MDIAEYILKVLTLLSAFIGVWVAIYNIDAWRREHQGKRQAELAEEVLGAFYKAFDVVRYVRSPIASESETGHVTQSKQETEHQYRARKQASVVFKRFNDHSELFSQLLAMRYRFMAAFGKEAAKPFDDLDAVTREVKIAANILSSMWAHRYYETDGERGERNAKEIEKYERIFWEWLPEEDTINPKLETIKVAIEETCRGIIQADNSLFALINAKLSWFK